MKKIFYFFGFVFLFFVCSSIAYTQPFSTVLPKGKLHSIKLGTISGIIKNESNIVLNFTSTTAQKGLYLTLHEIFESPIIPNGKDKKYEYDMGKELQNYVVHISKLNETLYAYKIYNVPLQKKFLIRCNTSNLENNTPVSTIANLNFIGAITYIIQKGFGVAKYLELVNIINPNSIIITKNIIIKN